MRQRRITVRKIISLITGALFLLILPVSVSEFELAGQSRVLAQSSGMAENQPDEVQLGLLGVIDGVDNMSNYSMNTRSLSITDSNEQALAGVSRVARRSLQRNKLEAGTEIAGQLTYLAQQTVYDHRMSWNDYETLLQIVEAEVTGGDLTSKMLVAGVVMNRVKDDRFPDTVHEVVWQSGQFQPVLDGRIHSVAVTAVTRTAVDRVLAGEDYTSGALFFFSRENSEHESVAWFDGSLVKLFDYGGHEYFTFRD